MSRWAPPLGDLTIGALERLFNALPRCTRACVVVTNLNDVGDRGLLVPTIVQPLLDVASYLLASHFGQRAFVCISH